MENITLEYTDVFDENRTKELVFSKHLLKTPFKENSLVAVLVDGKSMEPVINDRAVVIADLSQKDLVDNAIYLVNFDNRMWVKRYSESKKIFFSINPEFAHLNYNENDVHLIAKVLLTFTNL